MKVGGRASFEREKEKKNELCTVGEEGFESRELVSGTKEF